MARLIGAKLDLNKIPKEKIFKGKKGDYIDVTIAINDEEDQYGNDASISMSQSKEEREAGGGKTYLGNGKTFWSNESTAPAVPQSNAGADFHDEEDDLPF
jgi:hypothetical protein